MLAKWIAKQTDAKVIFDAQSTGASANMKTNEIFMPCDLKEHNILAALALLMHEGAHLKLSKKIPKKFMERKMTKDIVNVMEDVRINRHNFDILYNIRDFYERLVKDHVYTRKDEIAKETLFMRCMINSILILEGFRGMSDNEVSKIDDKYQVNEKINQGRWAIETENWDELQRQIDEIKRIFGIKEEDDTPLPSPSSGGEGNGDESAIPIQGSTDKYFRPTSAWDKGEGIRGPSRDIVGEAAFADITKEAFKELMNIKEHRTIYDGQKLNIEEITSFFTGELETLFLEDKIERVKKSKVAFCLDASGSMGSRLIDGQMRNDVLVKAVRSLINILKELQETEGLNISYDVYAFDTDCYKLDHEKWEREYSTHGGGTDLLKAFLLVQQDILDNQEIDGNKMVILVTDGEVGDEEVEELRNHIIKHGAEVKCMVLGIGANLNGHFVKNIVGDNNILAEEHADTVMMDAIKTMEE